MKIEKMLNILIAMSLFFAMFFMTIHFAQAEEYESKEDDIEHLKEQKEREAQKRADDKVREINERIAFRDRGGGDYQVGRSLELDCNYNEREGRRHGGWNTCRNSDAYAREWGLECGVIWNPCSTPPIPMCSETNVPRCHPIRYPAGGM